MRCAPFAPWASNRASVVRDAIASVVVKRARDRARFDDAFDGFFCARAAPDALGAARRRGLHRRRARRRCASCSTRSRRPRRTARSVRSSIAAPSSIACSSSRAARRCSTACRARSRPGSTRIACSSTSARGARRTSSRACACVSSMRSVRRAPTRSSPRSSARSSAPPTTFAASSSPRSRVAMPTPRSGDDLLGAPLASLDDAEVEEVRRAVRAFVQRLRGGERVRRRRARKGRIDAHATLRRAMRTGGVPFMLARRARRRDKPRLVLLCDVSDSVRSVARFLLELTYAAQELFDRTRTFVFVSELGETTRLFAEEPIETALSRAYAGGVVPVTHNSNYGRMLRAFEERVLARHRSPHDGRHPRRRSHELPGRRRRGPRRHPRARARGRLALPRATRGVGDGRQRDASLRAEVHARPRGALRARSRRRPRACSLALR